VTDWNDIHREHGAEGTRGAFDDAVKASKPNGNANDNIILTSRQFIAGFTPPDYLVKGILQRRFFYSLTANTGGGKTAIALLLAASAAQGHPFAGRTVSMGRVLYLAGENPDDLRMRWIAMGEKMGFDVDTISVCFIPGKFSIPAMMDRIRAEVEELGGVVLVIVDTSAVYFEGSEENANVAMGDHARMLRSLVSVLGGPTVLALCHPVKNAANDNLLPRGGGSYLDEVDGNLTSQKKSDVLIEIHWQGKFRGPDFAPLSFELVTVTSANLKDKDGDPIPTVLAKALSEDEEQKLHAMAKTDEDKLLVAMLDNAGASISALAEACDWFMKDGKAYRSKVQRLLRKLAKDKLTVSERGGAWSLTHKGEKAAEKARIDAELAGSRYG
jgi:hypothetical protein